PVVPSTVGPEPTGDEDSPEHRRRRRRRRMAIAAGAVLVAIAIVVVRSRGGGKAPPPRGGRVVSVVASPARAGDMPVYLHGLGPVTAINTVTVRSRVDGQLLEVAYHEGQLVRQGELLVQIDPRPFQVAVQQQEGQLARDEATLKNARLDLARYETLVKE